MGKDKNPYIPEKTEIIKIEKLGPWEKLFRLRFQNGKELNHKPLQFAEISIFGIGEAPISICSSPTEKRYFELAIRAVGDVTKALHNLKTGDIVGIRGPLGNGCPLKRIRKKDLLLIAGGIGLFPLRSLIHYILDKRDDFGKISILFGTKTISERLFPKELEEWKNRQDINLYETLDKPDEKWDGKVGLITTLIPPLEINLEKTFALLVGPPIMYKFVVAELKKKNLPDDQIIMSLERRMECGFGKCCRCQLNNGLYVCKDGPVFFYHQAKKEL